MGEHRIRAGDLYADILVYRRGRPDEVWYYILQRDGSSEILAWGSERTRQEAIKVANDFLDQFRPFSASSAAG